MESGERLFLKKYKIKGSNGDGERTSGMIMSDAGGHAPHSESPDRIQQRRRCILVLG